MLWVGRPIVRLEFLLVGYGWGIFRFLWRMKRSLFYWGCWGFKAEGGGCRPHPLRSACLIGFWRRVPREGMDTLSRWFKTTCWFKTTRWFETTRLAVFPQRMTIFIDQRDTFLLSDKGCGFFSWNVSFAAGWYREGIVSWFAAILRLEVVIQVILHVVPLSMVFDQKGYVHPLV